MSEGKEKSGHITVAMIGCLGTIAAAIIGGVFALLIAYLPPPSELGTLTATMPSAPQAATLMPASALTLPVPSLAGATEEVDVSGLWQGFLTYVLGDMVTNFRYQLELTQDGNVITGRSRIEQVGDANSFAEYEIGAQLIMAEGQIMLQLSETNLSNSNNYTSFVPSDPVVAKVMLLNYSASQDKQELKGEWRDYTGRNVPDGTIQLSKQP